MPAGSQTAANTAAVWTDLTKLSPMVWVEGARVAVQEIQPVMDMYDIDSLDEFNRDYGSIASSGFGKVITEGADYSVRFNNQGDTFSATVRKRGDAFTITEDLVDGNKYRDIRLGMEDLGGSLFRTRARDATHVQYTFGFSTSFTDSEGNTVTNGIAGATTEAVYADTHTMADASTFDNNLADTALGETALRNLEDLTVDFLDENGIPVTWGLGGKVLITSMDVGIGHTAGRLTMQPMEFDSANRNINPFSDSRFHGGAYTHLPLHYLATTATGARNSSIDKRYYINDRSLSKRSMIFADHTRPTPRGPFEDMFNGGMLWRSKTRFDIGTLYAHHGAASNATS